MIDRKYLHRAVLLGIGSWICFGLTAPMALASSIPELSTNAQEDGQDTLRQGLPGRRLGGGTRCVRILADSYNEIAVEAISNCLS